MAALDPQIVSDGTQIVTISSDNILVSNNFRTYSVGPSWVS